MAAVSDAPTAPPVPAMIREMTRPVADILGEAKLEPLGVSAPSPSARPLSARRYSPGDARPPAQAPALRAVAPVSPDVNTRKAADDQILQMIRPWCQPVETLLPGGRVPMELGPTLGERKRAREDAAGGVRKKRREDDGKGRARRPLITSSPAPEEGKARGKGKSRLGLSSVPPPMKEKRESGSEEEREGGTGKEKERRGGADMERKRKSHKIDTASRETDPKERRTASKSLGARKRSENGSTKSTPEKPSKREKDPPRRAPSIKITSQPAPLPKKSDKESNTNTIAIRLRSEPTKGDKDRPRDRDSEHDGDRSRTKDRERTRDVEKSRTADRDRDYEKDRDKVRDRDRDRDRRRRPDSRPERERDRDRDRTRDRDRDRDSERYQERTRDRDRDRDRGRSRDRDRSRERIRDRERSRERTRDRSRERGSERSRDRERERERDRSSRERERNGERTPQRKSKSDTDGESYRNMRGHDHDRDKERRDKDTERSMTRERTSKVQIPSSRPSSVRVPLSVSTPDDGASGSHDRRPVSETTVKEVGASDKPRFPRTEYHVAQARASELEGEFRAAKAKCAEMLEKKDYDEFEKSAILAFRLCFQWALARETLFRLNEKAMRPNRSKFSQAKRDVIEHYRYLTKSFATPKIEELERLNRKAAASFLTRGVQKVYLRMFAMQRLFEADKRKYHTEAQRAVEKAIRGRANDSTRKEDLSSKDLFNLKQVTMDYGNAIQIFEHIIADTGQGCEDAGNECMVQ